ncbi:MAG: IPT/TIG domain-containing protein, partial [Acidimicrobiales bacterium]
GVFAPGAFTFAAAVVTPAAAAGRFTTGPFLVYIFATLSFSHTGPLAVTAVTPNGGGAPTPVTISGTGLLGATVVMFGSYAAATPVVVVSDTQITTTAPVSPFYLATGNVDPLTVDVQVFTLDQPAGSPLNPPGDSYTFLAPAVVYSIAPISGTTAAVTPVTLYGKNFQQVSQIELGPYNAAASGVVPSADGSSLTATLNTPGFTGGLVGTYPVRAFNPAGFSAFNNPLFTVYQRGTPPAPPPTVLDNALSGRYGPVAIRYVVEQHDRLNNFIADLTPAVRQDNGCTVYLDNQRPVARTVDLVFGLPELLPAGFVQTSPATFCVAVYAVITAGGIDQRVQFGLFNLDQPTIVQMDNGKTEWQVKGADNALVLADRSTPIPYVVRAGSVYVNVVGAICTGFGLPQNVSALAGGGLGYTTPIDFVWPAGTTYLEIVNDLLFGINCYSIWADVAGTMTSRFRNDPATEQAAIAYSTAAEPRLLVAPTKRTASVASGTNQV